MNIYIHISILISICVLDIPLPIECSAEDTSSLAAKDDDGVDPFQEFGDISYKRHDDGSSLDDLGCSGFLPLDEYNTCSTLLLPRLEAS